MVASCASPLSWRPTSRALGALFAGSAVMFSAALLQGGTPLTAGDEVPAAAPRAEAATTGPSAAGATSAGVSQAGTAPAPAQAAEGTPGVTPDQGTRLTDQPTRRAPVRSAPQRSGPAPADAATDAEGNSASRYGGSDQTDEQQDDTVLGDVLDYFVKGFGG